MKKSVQVQLEIQDLTLRRAKIKSDGSLKTKPKAVLKLVHAGRRADAWGEFLASIGTEILTVVIAPHAKGAKTVKVFGKLGTASLKRPDEGQDFPTVTVPLEVETEDLVPGEAITAMWFRCCSAGKFGCDFTATVLQPTLADAPPAAQ